MNRQPTIELKTLSIQIPVGNEWESTSEVCGADDAVELARATAVAADIIGAWYTDVRLVINKNLYVVCRWGDAEQVVREWAGKPLPTEESCYE
jgi:hypothetical protein